jgi:hypothetical protein
MKIAIPSTPQQYFQQTEYAVKLAYSGINECWSYYREAAHLMSPHWRPSDEMDGMLQYDPPKDASARISELFDKHAELRFSEAILAGTILQAAHMAIAIFSKNSSVPPEYAPLVKSKEAVPFCIGKELYGVPTGLIVLAARNQFCHWNEPDV